MILLEGSYANNVQISTVTSTVNAGYTTVNFNISWENSWRGGPAANYDAIWVFMKYKDENAQFHHLNLTGANTTAGAGLTAEVPADNKGAFIYRSADGAGNIAATAVSIGVVPQAGMRDIEVFAVEMVYVPEGSFFAGGESGYSAGGTTGFPFKITSATPPGLGNASGRLYDPRLGGLLTLNANFPTGYNGFYMMKYELSQAGYRDFFNNIQNTYFSINERSDLTDVNYSIAGTKIFNAASLNRNFLEVRSPLGGYTLIGSDASNNNQYNEAADGEWVAANYLLWSDIAAFLDWAALRPMTELEYEKAARGPYDDQPAFVATGTNYSPPSDLAIINNGMANETVDNLNVNTNYINSSEMGIAGPLRNGFAATATSGRMKAGASYYGIMELSGNLWEPAVTTGNAAGRSFTGELGDGELDTYGRANAFGWPGKTNNSNDLQEAGYVAKTNISGIATKGGSFAETVTESRVAHLDIPPSWPTSRADLSNYGCRGVRQK